MSWPERLLGVSGNVFRFTTLVEMERRDNTNASPIHVQSYGINTLSCRPSLRRVSFSPCKIAPEIYKPVLGIYSNIVRLKLVDTHKTFEISVGLSYIRADYYWPGQLIYGLASGTLPPPAPLL